MAGWGWLATSLDLVLLLIGGWLLIGLLGVVSLRRFALVTRVLFPLGALVGLLLCLAGASALGAPPGQRLLPLGLPELPFHLRLDNLSAFFLMLIGGVASGVSLFAAGYFRQGEGTPPGLLCLEYHVFLASMALLVLADDAYSFMVMWETMALASYLLVAANHRIAEVRQAAYLYLTMAHIGAIAILLCFGVLQAHSGDYSFASLRAQELSPFWGSLAFGLAVFGFGAKAGLLPLHIWLPEAHPAAPSPVSALLSAVMLKLAVYGMLRVCFDLLEVRLWWWGAVLLLLGLATALFGVLFAAVQVDMKRLLAYSSIENLGLVFAGIGLTILFSAHGMSGAAALAFTASLYQVASHGLFKSLLFLATGCVLHATGERNLGRLGGLIRAMPWVAWLSLLGVLASAGLPPLSGFVAEWLLLQSFLFTPQLPDSLLNMLIPAAAAVIALVAALAGYTMVKFFGVIFLGQPREDRLAQAHDADGWERAGMLWLAAGSLALGLLPIGFISLIEPLSQQLLKTGIGAQVAGSSWLLVPNSIERASYGPVLFLLGVSACCALAWLLVRRLYHGRLRRAPAWDCGYPWLTPRMQDSAEGFGQPIRQIFEGLFAMERQLPTAFDAAPRYRVVVGDHCWRWLYLPIAGLAERIARLLGRLQQGRIAAYLLYSFITLITTLLLVQR